MSEEQSLKDKGEKKVELTSLISSNGVTASQVKTWQLSSFDVDEVDNVSVCQVMRESGEKNKENEPGTSLAKEPVTAELLQKEAYEQAYKEGYQAGFEQGIAEGSQQGKLEAKELVLKQNQEALSVHLEQLDSLVAVLQRPYEALEQQVFSELTALVWHIAEAIIKKEIHLDKNWIVSVIEETVRSLPDDAQPFVIELHPDDLAHLDALNLPEVKRWELRENPTISQGSCRVKQGNSSILNHWKLQFDEMMAHLESQ